MKVWYLDHSAVAVKTEKGDVFYIPMVEAYVQSIDFDQSEVTVDWSLDWN